MFQPEASHGLWGSKQQTSQMQQITVSRRVPSIQFLFYNLHMPAESQIILFVKKFGLSFHWSAYSSFNILIVWEHSAEGMAPSEIIMGG